jgi:hypothetical protein
MTLLAVAHRAGNSLDRLRRAVELGADVVETDVHGHRGRLEVRHAKTLGPLPWLWDDGRLLPGSTPRLGLAELLVAGRQGATFMLDLKGYRVRPGRQVAALLHELAPDRPVLVCSRFWPALRPFAALPWVRVVRSARNRAELALLLRVLRRSPCHGVSVHLSLLTPEVVAELHRHVELVMTWPVNDLVALDRVTGLAATGTVGVITDDDDVLARVLAARTG